MKTDEAIEKVAECLYRELTGRKWDSAKTPDKTLWRSTAKKALLSLGIGDSVYGSINAIMPVTLNVEGNLARKFCDSMYSNAMRTHETTLVTGVQDAYKQLVEQQF